MEESSVASGEMVWVIVVVLVILAVGVVIFTLNPKIQEGANQLICESYYNMLYFFFGPRPPIELCGKGGAVPLETPGPLIPGINP